MQSSYLIGIAGPSCSGKSEVARRLGRILRAPTLALDHYYRDLKHLTFEQRLTTNFDHPDSLDGELLGDHVRALKQGHSIQQPTYDFKQHIRAPDTETIHSSQFVLVEGLFALHWPEVRDQLNLKIYIEAEHDVCLARRIFRDMRERGRTEASVREQYESTVRDMCDCHVAPTKAHADLALSGVAPVKQSVYTILIYIAGHLGDPSLSNLAPAVED
jgi:uridine kinase